MPVAIKSTSIAEESELHRSCAEVNFDTNRNKSFKINPNLLDEMLQLFSNIDKYERDDKDNRMKVETLNAYQESAKESIVKAEEKRDALLNIKLALKDKIEKKKQSVEDAADAWHNSHGISVKQISSQNDDFKQYEFTYSKLPKPRRLEMAQLQQQQPQTETNGSTTTTTVINNGDAVYQNNFIYKVSLKHQSNTLTIVYQEPEILRPEEITTFNEDLTKTCICPNNLKVDYKLAVLKIKMAVVKSP